MDTKTDFADTLDAIRRRRAVRSRAAATSPEAASGARRHWAIGALQLLDQVESGELEGADCDRVLGDVARRLREATARDAGGGIGTRQRAQQEAR